MKKLFLLILFSISFLSLTSCDINIDFNNFFNSNDIDEDNFDNEKNLELDNLIKTCDHNFNDEICTICKTIKNEYIFNLYGNDTIIYTNEMENPYNIDLDEYGNNVHAVFYEPIFKGDSYKNINKNKFYNEYEKSKSYEDSYYRSLNGIMSGDISIQQYLPGDSGIKKDDIYIKCSDAYYVLDTFGNYIAYIINDLNFDYDIIYYGGAYTSLNEVCAYLLAFGEVPINSNYDKNDGVEESISKWGKYGRVNIDYFSGNTKSFPYEPLLPKVNLIKYTETDFGTSGGYINESISKKYEQKTYNNGSNISRGAARLCFVSDSKIKNIDERYVFYTYNHYNDFQQYLNYNDGFGLRFGNESAGNQYCSSRSDFEISALYNPTEYANVYNMSLKELIS